MGFLDAVFDIGQSAVAIEDIKGRYSMEVPNLMTDMAGNIGQLELTGRYGDNVPDYIEIIAKDNDEHKWPNFISRVAYDTSSDAIAGTIVILNVAFLYLTAMLIEIAEAKWQAVGGMLSEQVGGGERRLGQGGGSDRARKLRSAADTIRQRGENGLYRDRHYRNGRQLRDGADAEQRKESLGDLYRRLDAPGLDGLRARFNAGGTANQMRLFIDLDAYVPKPTTVVDVNGNRWTAVPNGTQYWDKDFTDYLGLKANFFYKDNGGKLWDMAQEHYLKTLHSNSMKYEDPYPNAKHGRYNPYEMQRDFWKGRMTGDNAFVGPKLWQGGMASPYG